MLEIKNNNLLSGKLSPSFGGYANQQLSPLNTKTSVEGKVQRSEIEDFVTNNISVGIKDSSEVPNLQNRRMI